MVKLYTRVKKSLPEIRISMVLFAPVATLRHVTDAVWYCEDTTIRNWDTIIGNPFSTVELSLVAIVLGLLTLGTTVADLLCDSICRSFTPIYSSLYHAMMLEPIVVQLSTFCSPEDAVTPSDVNVM